MCYMIVFSTNSDEDLTRLKSALIQFSRDLPASPRNSLLKYQNRWLLESEGGCSCGFRHLEGESIELGFCGPEEWWPEHEEKIAATRAAFEVFRSIAAQGYRIECIDNWMSDRMDFEPPLAEIEIVVDELAPEKFRFFEGYRFEFRAGSLAR